MCLSCSNEHVHVTLKRPLVAACIACALASAAYASGAFEGVDYICRGSDPRILGAPGAILQQVFSFPFKWLHHRPTIEVRRARQQVVLFPPFAALNIARRDGEWATIRFGWRWDENCGRYIADVILKLHWPTPLYY